MNWTREWPTKPGDYWFHGWLSSFDIDQGIEADTYLVEVIDTGGGKMVYTTPGQFIYKSEAGRGLWAPATVPIPDEAP